MKKTAEPKNVLTNPMKPLLIRSILNAYTFSLLGFLVALMLITFFSGESVNVAELNPLQILASVLVMILYLVMVYSGGWAFGFRDINVVKMGYLKDNPWKGLRLGLYTLIPTAALYLVTVIVELLPLGFTVLNWYELLHFIYKWYYLLTGQRWALYFLPWVLVPLMSHWGFYNGKRNISIIRRIVYTNPDKPRKRSDKRLR